MGIRKHFEEMKDEGDLKLRDITAETEEKEWKPGFDYEEEISDEDWEKIMKSLKALFPDDYANYISCAARLKILFPDRADELGLNDEVWDEVWNKVTERMKATRDVVFKRSLFSAAYRDMKALFPDRIDEVDFNDEDLEIAKRKDYNNGIYYLYELRSYKMIFPNRFASYQIGEGVVQKAVEGIRLTKEEKRWSDFVEEAALFRIVFPDQFDKIELDKNTWKHMRDELESSRDKEWGRFIILAFNLAVLAAKKVEVTDQGLKIEKAIVKQDFKQEKKPRPIRKKF